MLADDCCIEDSLVTTGYGRDGPECSVEKLLRSISLDIMPWYGIYPDGTRVAASVGPFFWIVHELPAGIQRYEVSLHLANIYGSNKQVFRLSMPRLLTIMWFTQKGLSWRKSVSPDGYAVAAIDKPLSSWDDCLYYAPLHNTGCWGHICMPHVCETTAGECVSGFVNNIFSSRFNADGGMYAGGGRYRTGLFSSLPKWDEATASNPHCGEQEPLLPFLYSKRNDCGVYSTYKADTPMRLRDFMQGITLKYDISFNGSQYAPPYPWEPPSMPKTSRDVIRYVRQAQY